MEDWGDEIFPEGVGIKLKKCQSKVAFSGCERSGSNL